MHFNLTLLFILLVTENLEGLLISRLVFMLRSTDGTGAIKAVINPTNMAQQQLHICTDKISFLEANVMCQMLNKGMAKSIWKYPLKYEDSRLIYLAGSRCLGTETNLQSCVDSVLVNSSTQCKSSSYLGVKCSNYLPNLVPDVNSVERSAYVQREPLHELFCAIEENCLQKSVLQKYKNWTQDDLYTKLSTRDGEMYRKLLRFSSIIHNKGTVPFQPHQSNPLLWEWHTCHQHFHSMAYFADYQILSHQPTVSPDRGYRGLGRGILATGHKASFCLEDNACTGGIQKMYKCSSNKSEPTALQGISPGCSDVYLHDIDCQWIDITGLPYDRYMFRMTVNPNFLVAESNYHDNTVACEFHYFEYYQALHYCHPVHPNVLW